MSAPDRYERRVWECVECCLPDPYNGDGDGIGSCMCPRCEHCGECQPCADNLGLHHCDYDPDYEWPEYDDHDPAEWLVPDDDGSAELGRRRRTVTLDVRGDVL